MFSLCIPTMNRFDKFLVNNLPKYIENKYIDEIIITDENGNDIKKICEKFPNNTKLKLFTNKQRLGPFLNKLEACKKAKNEWIVLIDSDNFADIDYFENGNSFIQKNDLSKNTILAPSWAQPNFDYRHLSDEIFRKGNIQNIRQREVVPPGAGASSDVLMNTGNYIINKYLIDNLNLKNELDKIPFSHSCDVIYMNTLFFEQLDLNMYIIPNMYYKHIVHSGSTYTEYSSKFQDFNNSIYKRYKIIK